LLKKKKYFQRPITKYSFNWLFSFYKIIEIDISSKIIVSEIGNIENLLNIKSGGYKNWIIEKFNTELVGYEIFLDKMNRK